MNATIHSLAEKVEPESPLYPVSVAVVGVALESMPLLREALGEGVICSPVATSYERGLSMIRERRPDVVVLAFDDEPDEAVYLADTLARSQPGLVLVALASAPDPGAMRTAMRAGIREYVVLPEDAEDLQRAVRAAGHSAAEVEPEEDRGRLVAILGTKGGSGSTMLAVNLAAELADRAGSMVVDLDFSMGDAAVYLDLSPEHDIGDVLRNLPRLDRRLLESTLVEHGSKVRVLAQPQEPPDEADFHTDGVLRTLDVCAETCPWVVVDCGSTINEATLAAASAADIVLLVCTPEVPAVRNAWRRLRLLERLDVPRDRVQLVVNRWQRGLGLSCKDIEVNLDIPVSVTIAEDVRTVRGAVNDGHLLRDENARSKAAANVATLAAQLAGDTGRSDGGGRASWFKFRR